LTGLKAGFSTLATYYLHDLQDFSAGDLARISLCGEENTAITEYDSLAEGIIASQFSQEYYQENQICKKTFTGFGSQALIRFIVQFFKTETLGAQGQLTDYFTATGFTTIRKYGFIPEGENFTISASEEGNMELKFNSDGSVQDKGFMIRYSGELNKESKHPRGTIITL